MGLVASAFLFQKVKILCLCDAVTGQILQPPLLPEAAAQHRSDGADISMVYFRRQFSGPPLQKSPGFRSLHCLRTISVSPQALVTDGKDNLITAGILHLLQFDKADGALIPTASHEKASPLVKMIGQHRLRDRRRQLSELFRCAALLIQIPGHLPVLHPVRQGPHICRSYIRT